MGAFIYNIFWWLGGANRKILKNHIEDHNKYFHIGATIFLTAVMATFTGTFASNYIINKGFDGDISPFAILFGIFWGIIILNLDRFIVVSMKKQGNSLITPTIYENFSNFMGEFIFAVPRILLALLIAHILLQPLELYLFKNQIDNLLPIIQMQESNNLDEEKSTKDKYRKKQFDIKKQSIIDEYQPKIDAEEIKQKKITKKIEDLKRYEDYGLKKLEEKKSKIYENYNSTLVVKEKECNIKGPNCTILYEETKNLNKELVDISSKIKHEKSLLKKEEIQRVKDARRLEEDKNSCINKINRLVNDKSLKLSTLAKKREEENNNLTKEIENLKTQILTTPNLAKALKAKDTLFKTDSIYDGIHYLLMLLLFTIELLPIILKILFARSSYDAHIQRISEEETLKHDTYLRELRLKYAKELRELKLLQTIEQMDLEKKLKRVKFSSNE